MSHSCFPNAVWYYDGADHVLRARRDIRAGDEVCISYLPEHGLLHTAPERRAELHSTKRFWCACERCAGGVDWSRGLRCPQCRGPVFARTPTAGPALKEGLLPSQLVGQACGECHHELSEKEVMVFAGYEKQLQSVIDNLQEMDKYPHSVSEAHLRGAEEFIDAHFHQHALADLAWEQLGFHYAATDRHEAQLRVLARRCDFQASAYPGLCGARAWALEAHSDALVTHAGDQNVAKARGLYKEAFDILSVLFGTEHEYVTSVVEKISQIPGS